MEILDQGKEISLIYLKRNPQERDCGFPLSALFITRYHETLSVAEFAELLNAGCSISPLQILYLYNVPLLRHLLKTGKMDANDVIFDFCKSRPEPGKSEKYIETLKVLLAEIRGKIEFFSEDGLRVRELLLLNNFTRRIYYEFMAENKERVIRYEDEVFGI